MQLILFFLLKKSSKRLNVIFLSSRTFQLETSEKRTTSLQLAWVPNVSFIPRFYCMFCEYTNTHVYVCIYKTYIKNWKGYKDGMPEVTETR